MEGIMTPTCFGLLLLLSLPDGSELLLVRFGYELLFIHKFVTFLCSLPLNHLLFRT